MKENHTGAEIFTGFINAQAEYNQKMIFLGTEWIKLWTLQIFNISNNALEYWSKILPERDTIYHLNKFDKKARSQPPIDPTGRNILPFKK